MQAIQNKTYFQLQSLHIEQKLYVILFTQGQPAKSFLVYTDGGGQYSSLAFQNLLELHGFRHITRRDNYCDNTYAIFFHWLSEPSKI
ncbi:MAG: hypothetical protein AB8B69_20480 [Chitinophagales bacterium]